MKIFLACYLPWTYFGFDKDVYMTEDSLQEFPSRFNNQQNIGVGGWFT